MPGSLNNNQMLAANTILQDRYRVVRQLGQGGMGAVYEAIDQRVSCIVALKQTLVRLDSVASRSFEREAALLANLRHPALPKVMDHFSEDDGQFLVMEYIPGYDLAELLEVRGSPFPQDQVLRWAIELLSVLEYLHGLRPPILHRDIKPSNLKLTRQGEIFLLDFGLAKGAVGQMSTLNSSKSERGFTPSFAPLEQILGRGTDPRSDLYSVGATLYQLLTSKVPFDAPGRFSAIEDGKDDPLPRIESLNPGISSSIASVIYQAMAMNRRQRPASAADMQIALGRAAAEDRRQAAEEECRRAEAKHRQQEEAEQRKTEEERRLQEAETRRVEEEMRIQREAEERQHDEAETARGAEEQRKKRERERERGRHEVEEAARKLSAASTAEQHRIAKERAQIAVEAERKLAADLSREQWEADPLRYLSEEFPRLDPRAVIVPEPAPFRAPETVPITSPANPLPQAGGMSLKPHAPTEDVGRSPDKPIAAAARATTGRASRLMRPWGAVLIAATTVAIIAAGMLLVKRYWAATQSQPIQTTRPPTAGSQANANDSDKSPPTPPPGMVYVLGGTFTMGRNKSDKGDKYESPAHQATVKPFYIDVYEVTNEDYAKFITATNHNPPSTWDGVYPKNDKRHPVTGVTWNDANDYARWVGKRLPTEEEWEFAARGTDGRRYAWGNEWGNGYANADGEQKHVVDVGTYKGTSPFGLFDMVGNAWEWTDSELTPYAVGSLPKKVSNDLKVIRGGTYSSNQDQATTTYRRGWRARGASGYGDTGFRCVKDGVQR